MKKQSYLVCSTFEKKVQILFVGTLLVKSWYFKEVNFKSNYFSVAKHFYKLEKFNSHNKNLYKYFKAILKLKILTAR